MTRIGGDRASGTPSRRAIPAGPHRVASALGTAALALALAGPASAGDDDGPDLTRPSNLPGLAAPITSSPAPAAASALNRRAVLAMPGLTSPSIRAAEAPPPALSLDGPLGMPTASPAARSGLAPLPDQGRSPRVLDDSPLDSGPILEPALPFEKPSRAPAATGPRSLDPLPGTPPPRPGPTAITAPPVRRNRFFGLLPAQPPPSARGSTRPGTVSAPGLAIASADPKADPAADSALRKRIEGQARVSVGDRAKSVEVKVAGKAATISARGVKFYQKRGVRKSLESLPAITGVRTTIEVND